MSSRYLAKYSHVKPGEVTDGLEFMLCVSNHYTRAYFSAKRVYDRAKTASGTWQVIAKLKEHGKISGYFCRYV